MPLRAILDGIDIFSHETDLQEWGVLRDTYRKHNLLMPCCGHNAIPKTSKLGFQFFAHARRGPCESGKETENHLRLKAILASAAKAAGWSVTTEWRGETDSGEEWIADVFCTKGQVSVALEAQWSPQTPDETRRRQIKYHQSGVRCAWFIKVRKNISNMDLMRPGFASSTLISEEETPTFYFKPGDETGEFYIPEFQMTVDQMSMHLMLGNIKYFPQNKTPLKASIIYEDGKCEWCGKNAKMILGIVLYNQINKAFQFYGSDLDWFSKLYEARELHEALQLDAYGIAKITSFFQSTREKFYRGKKHIYNTGKGISYDCPYCKSPSTNSGLSRIVKDCYHSNSAASTHQFTILNGIDIPLIEGKWTDVRPEAPWSINNIGDFKGDGWSASPFYDFWEENNPAKEHENQS